MNQGSCKKHQKVSPLSCSPVHPKSNNETETDKLTKLCRQLSCLENSIDLISFELMLLGLALFGAWRLATNLPRSLRPPDVVDDLLAANRGRHHM